MISICFVASVFNELTCTKPDVHSKIYTSPCRSLSPPKRKASLRYLDENGKFAVGRELLDLPRVIGPMKKGLTLSRTAIDSAAWAIVTDLRDMSPHRSPAFDLSLVVRTAASHVIAAIPLKPPAGIFVVKPAFLFPDRQRLRRVHLEIIKFGIVPLRTKLGLREPTRGEFAAAVGQVLPAKDAKLEHLLRC